MFRQSPGHILNTYIIKNWNFIHLTRRYLNDLMMSLFKDRIFAEKVANASSELFENAYKYSQDNSDFNILIDDIDDEVVLEIRNYPKNDPQKTISIIKTELEKVYGDNIDPKEAFKNKIMEFVNNPDSNLMLGFAKIRLETEAKITADIDKLGFISIKAHFKKS